MDFTNFSMIYYSQYSISTKKKTKLNKGTKNILTALFMLCLLINFISLDVSAEKIQYEPAVLNSDGYYEIDSTEKLFWFAAVVNEGYGDTPQNRSANALVTCKTKAPSTGSTVNLTLWFLLMIGSFMTIVLSIHRKKA